MQPLALDDCICNRLNLLAGNTAQSCYVTFEPHPCTFEVFFEPRAKPSKFRDKSLGVERCHHLRLANFRNYSWREKTVFTQCIQNGLERFGIRYAVVYNELNKWLQKLRSNKRGAPQSEFQRTSGALSLR